MKKLIAIVITIVITTIGYAQDSTILRAQAQQSCTWDEEFKDWYCIDFKYEGATFILKNEVFYVNDRYKSKYFLNGKGDYTDHNGFNSIIFKNVKDKDGKKCILSIITYSNGNSTMYIAYQTKQLRYFFNILN
tara:strand:+ start:14147 stop:14545 length:399 start_codon:yes stop_codon:yes gene_type:complete